ncbi:hypothetical protein [Polaromonas sp.]|uniref:hypothetical protein n=1 Tax=Polaromonas sp. TaxID=1869339 RepID=UPI003BAD8EE2
MKDWAERKRKKGLLSEQNFTKPAPDSNRAVLRAETTGAVRQKAKAVMSTQFDQLDQVAEEIRQRGETQRKFPYLFLSTSEHLYICLAANRADFLNAVGYSIPAALAQMGPDWTAALVQRHQYQST